MIIHIADDGFHTVRYYGFYNNKKQKQLYRIYELLNMEKHTSRTKRQREIERSRKLNKMKFRTAICDDFNRDI
ncbi:MAG: hypothetical protein IKQ27_14205, partial [Lachnospiraceae bacterium]|nr:hypothetical protein [Lachnospiraceae bacterium]